MKILKFEELERPNCEARTNKRACINGVSRKYTIDFEVQEMIVRTEVHLCSYHGLREEATSQ